VGGERKEERAVAAILNMAFTIDDFFSLDVAVHFVLKGALLLTLWSGRLRRPARDLDLLGY
jgi:hypothetical protein